MFYRVLVFSAIALSLSLNASAKTLSFGFGSCFSQHKDRRILSTMFKESFTDVFFLGDVPYSNYKKHGQSLRSLSSAYEELSFTPEFRALASTNNLHGIWDDHDYGINDGGKENPFKIQAQEQYLNLFRVPSNDQRRYQEGVYFSLIRKLKNKTVKFIMLDTRYHRDALLRGPGGHKRYTPDYENVNKTILGEAQWQWLQRELAERVDVLFLGSSIQVLATNHRFEKWHNLPYERERLLKLLDAAPASKKVILSGDRHFSAIYKWKSCNTCGEVTEFTVSGLNKRLSSSIDLGMDPLQTIKGIRKENYLDLSVYSNSDLIGIGYKDKNGKIIFEANL